MFADSVQVVLQILLSIGFGAGAGVFFWRFYRSMDAGEELRIDYRWGGLGGGLGGWRISKPVGYLFAAFALGGLLAVSVVGLHQDKPAQENAGRTGGQATAAQTTGERKTADEKV